MIRADQVRAWLGQLWESSPALQVVDGGLHHKRAGQTTGDLYAVYMLKDEDKILHSGGAIVKYLLTLALYEKPDADDHNKAKHAEAILGRLLDRPSAFSLIRGGKVMGVEPISSDVDLTPERRDAEDVLVTTNAWRIWCSSGN